MLIFRALEERGLGFRIQTSNRQEVMKEMVRISVVIVWS